MESRHIKLRKGDWAITIYREGGYSISTCVKFLNGDLLWVEASEPDECPFELVSDAKVVYRAMHGREMYW